MASRLTKSVRLNDYVYRTGGDEIVVVLTDLDAEHATQVSPEFMQRLVEEVSALYYVQTIDIHIGVSVGISFFLHKGEGLNNRILGFESLIRWAHPERGEIPLGDFISIAEKLNLMDEIEICVATYRG